MFVEIIDNLEMNGTEKTLKAAMAQIFDAGLPKTLSMTHYELAENFGYDPQSWKGFLKIKEISRVIESEMAAIAEIGARKALARLQTGEASSPEISAAKEVLANSKLLRQKNNQRPQIIITRIPPKMEEVPSFVKEKESNGI